MRLRTGFVAGCVLVAGAILSSFVLSAPPAAAGGSILDRHEMESYIVQSKSAMAGGPIGDDRQNIGDAVLWRKHDWANESDRNNRRAGYQASDSVVENLPGGRLYVQTFDFGDPPRRFQRFDLGRGDGGQALVIDKGAVYGAMTEDGGGGVQWFVGRACQTSDPRGPFKSWLFFDNAVSRSAWTTRTAHLNIERTASKCPWSFNDAYTRWRRLDAHFPYRIAVPGQSVKKGTFKVDAILSEHYGGSSIAQAQHLERFWFARGYGLLRWERWENADLSKRRHIRLDAELLAQNKRCGPVEGSKAPGSGWFMVDCRTWTNFVRLSHPWKVAAFNWPRPDVIAQFEKIFARR